MSDNEIKTVEEMSSDNAVLLLGAAEELGYEPDVVRTGEGGFSAPADVVYKAFPERKKADADLEKAEKARQAKAEKDGE